MSEGTIKIWFSNKGYGFIERKGQDNLFFHVTQWKGLDRSEPPKGASVSFEVGPGRNGMEAKNVRLLNADSQATPSELDKKIHIDNNEYRFLNPYNFVRYLGSRPKDSILGKCPPPTHDRYVGLTGRIICTAKAETPLFVSDSHAIQDNRGHKTYRFFEYGDEPALPSSSLRGMLRSVFEAVTNSCYLTLTDKKLSKHVIPQDAARLIPARVEKDGDKISLRLLSGTCLADPNGISKSSPQYAAWIRLYNPIRSSATAKQNPGTTYAKRPLLSLPKDMKHGSPCKVIIQRMQHPCRIIKGKPLGQFDFWNVESISESSGTLPKLAPDQKAVNGWLCITNQNIENKHDERIFFAESTYICLQITDRLKKDYEDLIADYQERHEDAVSQRCSDGLPFDKPIFDLKMGTQKSGLSRFIYDKNERYLKDGDLVYAMLEGTIEIPQIKFIVPVSIPRVVYNRSVDELLTQDHLRRCDKPDALCPACRMFGWVNDKPIKGAKHIAYASRVQLSHGKQISSKGSLPDTTLAILSTPKPTTTSFYLLDSQGKPDPTVDYDTDGARLRGRKFYRHQGRAVPSEYTGNEPIDQNRTVHGALNPGATFEFTMDFENLAPLELGALLYSLEMEEGMFHRLGYAKPLGFGSIKVTVDNVKRIDWSDRLSSLNPDAGWSPLDKTVLKQMFLQEMRANYDEFDDILGDLKALLSKPPELPIHYPRRTRSLDKDHPQYEWFMGNKRLREKGKALDLARDDKKGLPLIDKYGKIGDGI